MSAADGIRAGSPVKLLLVGPYPPPHGGISVHVATAHRLLSRSGAVCEALGADGRRPGEVPDGRRAAIGGGARKLARLVTRVRARARRGWTLHLHTNGHNWKSWLLVLAAGRAARPAPGRIVTLHSGMVPAYLASGGRRGRLTRRLAALALRPYGRVLCVNPEIRAAVASLGIAAERLEVAPAYLPAAPAAERLPADFESWLAGHRPVLSSALFFRPEYGFDLLVDALRELRSRHPGLGCLVLGSGEDEPAARQRLRAEGMDGWVCLTGDLSHELCLTVMARSDVFVRPTLVDGDANSVREALSLGVPVVASDVGNRPPGTVLFRCGSREELVARIDEVLAARGAGAPSGALAPAAGDRGSDEAVDRLLRTYLEVTA